MPRNVIEFKSTSLNVPILLLHGNDPKQIELQLQEKTAQAPEFFKHSPLLIDLQELNKQALPVDLPAIVELLKNNYFITIGIRGGNQEQNQIAIDLGLQAHAIHASQPTPGQQSAESKAQKPTPKPQAPAASSENKLITHPIRSGQQVYAKGDLIITATVSAGAEILAEGNIHIYGSLRGRALAGVQGDTNSRIFCSDLQAELISIAGNYKINDELDESVRNHPVQIYLQDQALIITPI